jgi:Zn-finger nucleic acid-binding protein
MKCPRCEIDFERSEVGTVRVEECGTCGGMWLGEEELRRAKDETDPDLNWMDFDLWRHRDQFNVVDRAAGCPACGGDMVVLDYGETDVQVDYCEHCRGVWLEGGEFEKIIAALRQELTTKKLPGYILASLKEARDLVRREEGLLSDWTDLRTVLRMLKYRIMSRTTGVVKFLAEIQSRNPVQ